MGSGHFLVEVTEHIARFLVELGVAPEEAEGDGEAELAYWKRRVVQSCVYGVDLNPLAVDLAKLSLWLATVARDRPLSFLDHHLRTGNSLVGAHTDDLRPAGKRRKKKAADDGAQLSMLEDDAFRRTVSNAVGNIWLIEGSSADTVESVKEQERLYAGLRENLNRRYARLANLAVATSFGVEVDRTLWRPLADYATKGGIAAPPQFDAWLQAAEEAARQRRFFHWELEFPEVYFDRQGRLLGDAAGFDAVVGNPPYVRQESLGDLKPYLAGAYPETYHGVADLYVYFYQQGLQQSRRGGRMGYIVTNKWLRAGYGEPLRGFFAAEGALEEILDFGHAPIFPDADVFPCIVVLKKPERTPANGDVRVVEFPREALKENADLAAYVEDHAHAVPKKRFGKNAWSLETAAVDDLMAKIRANGVPLSEYAGVKPYRGVLTGLNEAFLIDTATKERLVREDPRSAGIIKPYLRGQDIKRWSPEWRGLWIIVLKSSGDHAWPWSNAGEDVEEIFRQTYPSLHAHMKPLEARLRKRSDKGRHWWELRSCAYYDAFERPKIMYQVIQFHPQYGVSENELFSNDKTFFVPSYDAWLLAVLNSSLMWWHNWRYLGHMKDEALNPANWLMEKLPIAPPTDEVREEAENAVARLISLTTTERDARRDTLDWLRIEFGVHKPGQKIEDFAALDPGAFVEEVRKRRPKDEGRLTPGSLRDLRSGYGEGAAPIREARAEAAKLESRLSDLVNEAYGPTPGEVDLLWSTAPPRMPRF